MNSNRHYFVLTLFCLLGFGISSCSEEDPLPIGKLYWLEGDWKGRVHGGMMYESWELGIDSAIVGQARIMVQGDTIFHEFMQIIKEDDQLFYIATVSHNTDPVSFKLVKWDSKGYLFENKNHDYPTRIIYANTLGDMMLVRIEGMKEEKGDTARFFMHRDVKFPPENSEQDGGFMSAPF